jgi:hypothetical protein
MQPGPNVIRSVRIATALVPRYQGSTCDDAGDTGKPDPLPDPTHAHQSA